MLRASCLRDATKAGRPGIGALTASALLVTFWCASLLGHDERLGPVPRRFEARLRRLFENNAPGIRFLAVPMNGLLYLFGERRGSEQVFAASSRHSGRWLFLAAELELERPNLAVHPAVQGNLAAIQTRVTELRQAGVARVVVVPVPSKLSVMLGADPSLRASVADVTRSLRPRDASCDGKLGQRAYDDVVAHLGSLEAVKVAALHDLLVAQAQGVRAPVFLYEDTHWTSLGLSLAAAEILGAWHGGPVREPVRTGTLPDAPGDLQRLLALPAVAWARAHPAPEDVYELPADALPACEARSFLLGSSYSRHRGPGLATQLAHASGCGITDLSLEGRGPVAAFPELLGRHADELRGAVVIWEFPFRNLVERGAFAAP